MDPYARETGSFGGHARYVYEAPTDPSAAPAHWPNKPPTGRGNRGGPHQVQLGRPSRQHPYPARHFKQQQGKAGGGQKRWQGFQPRQRAYGGSGGQRHDVPSGAYGRSPPPQRHRGDSGRSVHQWGEQRVQQPVHQLPQRTPDPPAAEEQGALDAVPAEEGSVGLGAAGAPLPRAISLPPHLKGRYQQQQQQAEQHPGDTYHQHHQTPGEHQWQPLQKRQRQRRVSDDRPTTQQDHHQQHEQQTPQDNHLEGVPPQQAQRQQEEEQAVPKGARSSWDLPARLQGRVGAGIPDGGTVGVPQAAAPAVGTALPPIPRVVALVGEHPQRHVGEAAVGMVAATAAAGSPGRQMAAVEGGEQHGGCLQDQPYSPTHTLLPQLPPRLRGRVGPCSAAAQALVPPPAATVLGGAGDPGPHEPHMGPGPAAAAAPAVPAAAAGYQGGLADASQPPKGQPARAEEHQDRRQQDRAQGAGQQDKGQQQDQPTVHCLHLATQQHDNQEQQQLQQAGPSRAAPTQPPARRAGKRSRWDSAPASAAVVLPHAHGVALQGDNAVEERVQQLGLRAAALARPDAQPGSQEQQQQQQLLPGPFPDRWQLADEEPAVPAVCAEAGAAAGQGATSQGHGTLQQPATDCPGEGGGHEESEPGRQPGCGGEERLGRWRGGRVRASRWQPKRSRSPPRHSVGKDLCHHDQSKEPITQQPNGTRRRRMSRWGGPSPTTIPNTGAPGHPDAVVEAGIPAEHPMPAAEGRGQEVEELRGRSRSPSDRRQQRSRDRSASDRQQQHTGDGDLPARQQELRSRGKSPSGPKEDRSRDRSPPNWHQQQHQQHRSSRQEQQQNGRPPHQQNGRGGRRGRSSSRGDESRTCHPAIPAPEPKADPAIHNNSGSNKRRPTRYETPSPTRCTHCGTPEPVVAGFLDAGVGGFPTAELAAGYPGRHAAVAPADRVDGRNYFNSHRGRRGHPNGHRSEERVQRQQHYPQHQRDGRYKQDQRLQRQGRYRRHQPEICRLQERERYNQRYRLQEQGQYSPDQEDRYRVQRQEQYAPDQEERYRVQEHDQRYAPDQEEQHRLQQQNFPDQEGQYSPYQEERYRLQQQGQHGPGWQQQAEHDGLHQHEYFEVDVLVLAGSRGRDRSRSRSRSPSRAGGRDRSLGHDERPVSAGPAAPAGPAVRDREEMVPRDKPIGLSPSGEHSAGGHSSGCTGSGAPSHSGPSSGGEGDNKTGVSSGGTGGTGGTGSSSHKASEWLGGSGPSADEGEGAKHAGPRSSNPSVHSVPGCDSPLGTPLLPPGFGPAVPAMQLDVVAAAAEQAAGAPGEGAAAGPPQAEPDQEQAPLQHQDCGGQQVVKSSCLEQHQREQVRVQQEQEENWDREEPQEQPEEEPAGGEGSIELDYGEDDYTYDYSYYQAAAQQDGGQQGAPLQQEAPAEVEAEQAQQTQQQPGVQAGIALSAAAGELPAAHGQRAGGHGSAGTAANGRQLGRGTGSGTAAANEGQPSGAVDAAALEEQRHHAGAGLTSADRKQPSGGAGYAALPTNQPPGGEQVSLAAAAAAMAKAGFLAGTTPAGMSWHEMVQLAEGEAAVGNMPAGRPAVLWDEAAGEDSGPPALTPGQHQQREQEEQEEVESRELPGQRGQSAPAPQPAQLMEQSAESAGEAPQAQQQQQQQGRQAADNQEMPPPQPRQKQQMQQLVVQPIRLARPAPSVCISVWRTCDTPPRQPRVPPKPSNHYTSGSTGQAPASAAVPAAAAAAAAALHMCVAPAAAGGVNHLPAEVASRFSPGCSLASALPTAVPAGGAQGGEGAFWYWDSKLERVVKMAWYMG